jgi:hypothetical protein
LFIHERRQILESISVQKNILAYGEQIITELLLELKKNKFYKKDYFFI